MIIHNGIERHRAKDVGLKAFEDVDACRCHHIIAPDEHSIAQLDMSPHLRPHPSVFVRLIDHRAPVN